ncbi:aldo/keto reductase, partial [Aphanizomenon sp. PH219]|nr:aldo/keto reductase [Aphanizomenon sp. 202]MDK2461153.1 aldo/keto reductase [Aphanizomenon sp. PH219]
MTLPTTKLGQTGLTVSRLVIGTMTFGLQTDEETSIKILDTAAEAGINFLDTADVYPLVDTPRSKDTGILNRIIANT